MSLVNSAFRSLGNYRLIKFLKFDFGARLHLTPKNCQSKTTDVSAKIGSAPKTPRIFYFRVAFHTQTRRSKSC